MTYSTFYVLNGLQNGLKGFPALTTSGQMLKDGHYYLLEDQVDPTTAPFLSHDEAFAAAKDAFHRQTWAFPLDFNDENKPHRVKSDDYEAMSDCNIATIYLGDDLIYEVTIEGSYDTLTLRMNAPSYEAVAEVYAALLQTSAKYQG